MCGSLKIIWSTLLILMCSLIFSPNYAKAVEKIPINNVILISVGGLNYEGCTNVGSPNLRYLQMDGVISDKTLAIRTDTIEAAEASLLTGTLVDEHKHLTQNDRVEVESLFDVFKKNGRTIFVVDGSGGKLQSFARGPKEYLKTTHPSSSKDTFNAAYKAISEQKPFFTYIYVDDCNDALLTFDQKSYYEAIRKFDAQLGVFMKQLRDSGLYKNSLIIVTSARSSSPSNQVPLIMCGPQCKINTTIKPAMVIDVAPSICYWLGIDLPANSRGIPVYEAMAINETEKEQFFNTWLRDLQKDRAANWVMNYRLEDQLYRTIHQMTSIKEEKQSIFDFAGEREQIIASLKSKLNIERSIWGGIILLLLGGYVVEYLWLKKKYLLFK